MKLRNTIIYLIGIPAVGKYTVAREIGRITRAKVVDNQLINNPVFTVVGYDGMSSFPFPQKAWKQIQKIQRAVLTVIRDCCSPDDSFVFTNVLDAKGPGDRAWFRRIERLARRRRAAFFPVWITCDASIIRQRKNTPERRARLKEIDLTTISWWLDEFELLRVEHPNGLTLDTSHYKPQQVARQILKHVQMAARRENSKSKVKVPTSRGRRKSGHGSRSSLNR